MATPEHLRAERRIEELVGELAELVEWANRDSRDWAFGALVGAWRFIPPDADACTRSSSCCTR